MRIGIPREVKQGEQRVALGPREVAILAAEGHEVLVEAQAGIGVGGILSGADARAKVAAGASLVQVYTGFIYRGPDVILQARRALKS